MTRTISPSYSLKVLARSGELTVVDLAHSLTGSHAVPGELIRPDPALVGSEKLTRPDPALIGKVVREHAVADISFTKQQQQYERVDDLLTGVVGAPSWGNLLRTGAELHVNSDGYEVRFLCMAPSRPQVSFDYSRFMYVDSRLSYKLALLFPEEPRVGGGDPLLIAPWRDPEMLGHAVLTMFRLCRPPFGNNVKESVLDPPDGKRRTALHRAALSGNLEELPPAGRRTRRKLDAHDTLGATPLMLAAQAGHICVVERLLGLGAQPDLVDKEGRSALHHAAQARHADVSRLLLEAGATPSLADRFSETPLHAASEGGHAKTVGLLLDAGTDSGLKDDLSRSTPLHRAARGGHPEVVSLLIEAGSPIDAPNEWGRTPLHVAAGYGHVDAVRTLVELGAGVNRRDHADETPLHRPAFFGHTDCITLLVGAGADPDARNENGNTPLHVAAGMNRWETASILLDAGPDIEASNLEGLTPLDVALVNVHTAGGDHEHNAEAIELLLDRGAMLDPMRIPVGDRHVLWPHLTPSDLLREDGSIDYPMLPDLPQSTKSALPADYWGLPPVSEVVTVITALHDAVEKQMVDLVRLLLESGVPPVTSRHSRPTLHVAAEVGNIEVAALLLDYGADTETPQSALSKEIRNERRGGNQAWSAMTALDWAKYKEQPEMVEFLLERGAIPLRWDDVCYRWVPDPDAARQPKVS